MKSYGSGSDSSHTSRTLIISTVIIQIYMLSCYWLEISADLHLKMSTPHLIKNKRFLRFVLSIWIVCIFSRSEIHGYHGAPPALAVHDLQIHGASTRFPWCEVSPVNGGTRRAWVARFCEHSLVCAWSAILTIFLTLYSLVTQN